MLVMEYKILPLALDIQGFSGLGGDITAEKTPNTMLSKEQFSNLFLYLLIAQGLFTGLAIGKLTEGAIRAGIRHSFIMVISAVLITTGTRLIF